LHLAPSLLAALVLARASAFKLCDLVRFEGVIANYRLLPRATAPIIARALPVIEIALAIGLVAPWTRAGSDLIAAGLLVIFAAAVAINITRGRREIDCGCGDPAHSQPLAWGLVARNLALAVALTAAAIAPGGAASLPGVAISLAAALAGLTLILCQEAFGALPARDGAQASRARLILRPEGRS
jgi:hypothetical protein